MKRKFLAVLLSVALVLTACPFAFATEDDFTPTPAPEATPAATQTASVTESTHENSDAPTTDPTQTATDAPVTDPTQSTEPSSTPTQSTEPSSDPTQSTEPSSDPTQSTEPSSTPTQSTEPSSTPTQSTEPSSTPTQPTEPTTDPTQPTEPTADPTQPTEPTADPNPLKAAMTANKPSVLAGSEKIELTLSVAGGDAPYSVAVTSAQGETVLSSEILTLNEAGEIVWGADAAPEMGAQSLTAVVTDALGRTATVKVELPVAEKISEDVAATVRNVELTGDWAKDLIAVARTQIGYHESETSFRIDADGKQHGYTRYGLWYGNAYGEWCGMFISFCLNYANIPEADFPREANCNKWRSALKGIAVYEDDEDAYTPAPGDLVFFDITGETNDPGHVGIVTRVDGDKIYTIEGNQIRAVREMEYKKDDKTIVGYANMAKIVARAAVKEATAKPAETDYAAIAGRTGIMTGDKVNVRERPAKDAAPLGQTGVKGETVTVIAAETVGEEIWLKVEYGEITGYVSAKYVFVPAAEKAAEATAEPTVEPTIVNNATAAAVEGGVELTFAVSDENASYIWERGALNDAGELVWETAAEGSAYTVPATVEGMKYVYRCTAGALVSEPVKAVRDDIYEWLNTADVTDDMLARALNAASLESLVLEGEALVSVRDGQTVADYDAETGALIDRATGLTVAYIVDGTVVPAVQAGDAA